MISDYNRRIAKNYAQVLFDLSINRRTMDLLFQAFSEILSQLKENTTLQSLFKNPLLSPKDQKNILSLFIDPSLDLFFSFIIQKKRLALLGLIGESFMELVENYKNQGRAFLETATPLTKDQRNSLTKKIQPLLGLDHLIIEEKINPRLLGGFRLKIKGKVFDASLMTQGQNILKESYV